MREIHPNYIKWSKIQQQQNWREKKQQQQANKQINKRKKHENIDYLMPMHNVVAKM